jgi:succinate dehydrogenase / fumarate reductase cytochrome b subunit
LSGVVPLGAFLALHLALNESAVWSYNAFVRVVGAIDRTPLLRLLEAVFIFVPLAWHAAFGLWLVVSGRPLAPASPYPARLRLAVRVTGVLATAFLAMHLPEFRFRMAGARLGGGELATLLAAELSSTSHGVPWRGVAYLAGTGCVAFHFAAGFWGFFAASRLGRNGAVGRRRAAWGAAALGAAIWLAFANIVVFHATGAAVIGRPISESLGGAQVPCPTPAGK